jgi:hypothetical protein
VPYVPAAVIVCRTDDLRAVGGFDPDLRWGEDVDLVWRLVESGRRCRFEPAVVARHRTRRTLRGWVVQRFRYGTSAAPLERRHPGALAPVRMSGWSGAAWAVAAVGAPAAGAGIAAATAVALVRKLPDLPAAESLRLAGLGHLHAGRLLGSTMVRAWWPAAVLVAARSTRARRLVTVAAVLPPLLRWRRERPAIGAVPFVALSVLDDVAYGAGVWSGAIAHREPGCLLPSFVRWPPS